MLTMRSTQDGTIHVPGRRCGQQRARGTLECEHVRRSANWRRPNNFRGERLLRRRPMKGEYGGWKFVSGYAARTSEAEKTEDQRLTRIRPLCVLTGLDSTDKTPNLFSLFSLCSLSVLSLFSLSLPPSTLLHRRTSRRSLSDSRILVVLLLVVLLVVVLGQAACIAGETIRS